MDGVHLVYISKLLLLECEVVTNDCKIQMIEARFDIIKSLILNIIETKGIEETIDNAINGNEIDLAKIAIILLAFGFKIECKEFI